MSISLTCRRVALAVVSVGVVAVVAGCGQDQVLIARVPETAIPSGTADSRAQAAVNTYKGFLDAVYYAQRKPRIVGTDVEDEANFSRYSFDPVQAEYEAFLTNLVKTHQAFRGAPPSSSITVKSIDLGGSPYPAVTLADCQTGGHTWKAYGTQAAGASPLVTPDSAGPNGYIVTMIYSRQHWGVMAMRPDLSGACTE